MECFPVHPEGAAPPRSYTRIWFAKWALSSQRIEKGDEVGFLLWRQAQIEARLVEVHYLSQGGRRTVVEVGSAGGKAAQDGPLELANVGALAGDESASRIGHLK